MKTKKAKKGRVVCMEALPLSCIFLDAAVGIYNAVVIYQKRQSMDRLSLNAMLLEMKKSSPARKSEGVWEMRGSLVLQANDATEKR